MFLNFTADCNKSYAKFLSMKGPLPHLQKYIASYFFTLYGTRWLFLNKNVTSIVGELLWPYVPQIFFIKKIMSSS